MCSAAHGSTPVLLRRACTDDEAALAAVRSAAILQLAAPDLSAGEAADWAAGTTVERFAFALREHEVWVAERDRAVIAWVEIDGARIAALYVHPEHAGRGLGTLLMRHAEERLRASGHAVAHLEASRNARHFYERLGYRAAGVPDTRGAQPMVKAL